MAPPVSEGAERASRKGIGAPDRQRHGQGIARALRWREMLKNATLCDHRRDRINESYCGVPTLPARADESDRIES
jgi:hypothetical protein